MVLSSYCNQVSVLITGAGGNDNGLPLPLDGEITPTESDPLTGTHGYRNLKPVQLQWNIRNCADIAQMTMVFHSGCEQDR